MLLGKHIKASKAPNEILLGEETRDVHLVIYDRIDSDREAVDALVNNTKLLTNEPGFLMFSGGRERVHWQPMG